MRVYILNCFISLFLFLQSGCSIGPIVQAPADDTILTEPTGVRLMHSDNRSDMAISSLREYVTLDSIWQADNKMDQIKTCRIKYHNHYYKHGYIVVEGRIGFKANRYPVVLDTGASQPIFLNVSHVLDNKLRVFPMDDTVSDLNGHKLGLCELPLLQIGDIIFTNQPCLYLEPPAIVNLFGIRIAGKNSNSNIVIVGLPVLREFKYVMFDNIRKEVEFSCNQTFEPTKPKLWGKYPLTVEEDFHGNAFLYVRIPIAGEEIELQFDTGSGRGLAIGEKIWVQIGNKIQDLNLKKGRDLYPYIGRLKCSKGVIPELLVGDRTVKNAKISIFPNDSPLLEDCEGLLGMQYFQNAVVVLDFENSLMWIQNQAI